MWAAAFFLFTSSLEADQHFERCLPRLEAVIQSHKVLNAPDDSVARNAMKVNYLFYLKWVSDKTKRPNFRDWNSIPDAETLWKYILKGAPTPLALRISAAPYSPEEKEVFWRIVGQKL